jgi:hypothetical protein
VKAMDHNLNENTGHVYLALAIACKLFAFLTARLGFITYASFISGFSTIVTICAALMAIRHYYLTDKKQK